MLDRITETGVEILTRPPTSSQNKKKKKKKNNGGADAGTATPTENGNGTSGAATPTTEVARGVENLEVEASS